MASPPPPSGLLQESWRGVLVANIARQGQAPPGRKITPGSLSLVPFGTGSVGLGSVGLGSVGAGHDQFALVNAFLSLELGRDLLQPFRRSAEDNDLQAQVVRQMHMRGGHDQIGVVVL